MKKETIIDYVLEIVLLIIVFPLIMFFYIKDFIFSEKENLEENERERKGIKRKYYP